MRNTRVNFVRKMKFRFVAIVLGIFAVAFTSSTSYGQDPEFTQFYANPIYLNPALAGAANCPRFAMNHRNQWPSLSGAYVTNSFSYDQYINSINGGIAVMVTNDMAGNNTLNWSTLNAAILLSLETYQEIFIHVWGSGHVESKICRLG